MAQLTTLGLLGLLAAVLFIPSARPADRLERLIRAWRSRR
jgi:hypothetical protein